MAQKARRLRPSKLEPFLQRLSQSMQAVCAEFGATQFEAVAMAMGHYANAGEHAIEQMQLLLDEFAEQAVQQELEWQKSGLRPVPAQQRQSGWAILRDPK